MLLNMVFIPNYLNHFLVTNYNKIFFLKHFTRIFSIEYATRFGFILIIAILQHRQKWSKEKYVEQSSEQTKCGADGSMDEVCNAKFTIFMNQWAGLSGALV